MNNDHNRPAGIWSSSDPDLMAELERRLNDTTPGAWLTLEEFRAQVSAKAGPELDLRWAEYKRDPASALTLGELMQRVERKLR